MVADWIGETLNVLVSPLNSVADAIDWVAQGIGNEFDEMGQNLSDWFGGVTSSLSDLFDSVGSILDYLNPMSENNFLRILFIPSDGYFDAYVDDLKSMIDSKIPIYQQTLDTWDSVKTAVQDNLNDWSGITADFSRYGIGEIVVIDPTFVNAIAPKLRFWIGAALYFMTFLFIVKRSSQLIGAGR